MEPVPVTGLAANFSPMPRTAPPPLGKGDGRRSQLLLAVRSTFCLLRRSHNWPPYLCCSAAPAGLSAELISQLLPPSQFGSYAAAAYIVIGIRWRLEYSALDWQWHELILSDVSYLQIPAARSRIAPQALRLQCLQRSRVVPCLMTRGSAFTGELVDGAEEAVRTARHDNRSLSSGRPGARAAPGQSGCRVRFQAGGWRTECRIEKF